LGTSLLFLGTILAVVVYLSVTKKDRTELANPAQADADEARAEERRT
jgi:hypothetical protein